MRRTKAGAWTTGVPSSRKVGFEIFLRFLSEDLSRWAYEGTEAVGGKAWSEEDCNFESRTELDIRTSLEVKDFPVGSAVGGSPGGDIDCGVTKSAAGFLGH